MVGAASITRELFQNRYYMFTLLRYNLQALLKITFVQSRLKFI